MIFFRKYRKWAIVLVATVGIIGVVSGTAMPQDGGQREMLDSHLITALVGDTTPTAKLPDVFTSDESAVLGVQDASVVQLGDGSTAGSHIIKGNLNLPNTDLLRIVGPGYFRIDGDIALKRGSTVLLSGHSTCFVGEFMFPPGIRVVDFRRKSITFRQGDEELVKDALKDSGTRLSAVFPGCLELPQKLHINGDLWIYTR